MCFAVLILCGEDDTAYDFMMEARHHDMVTDEYAYIFLDIFHRNTLRPWQVKSFKTNETTYEAYARFHPVSNFKQRFLWLNLRDGFKFSQWGIPLFVFKRNAKAFSLNAIAYVRRRRLRRHEIIFLNISETIRASDFKIYHKVALDGLCISTGNDIINCFRSEANCTNV